MWIIVSFIDDQIVAVPISWVINCNGQIQCWWPLRDERKKRSRSETPTSFEMDEWELHDCVMLLNGAIYDDFEEALVVEMGEVDINDVSVTDRPKLSWHEAGENIDIFSNNTESNNSFEIPVVNDEDLSFSEFAAFLVNQDLCSSARVHINQNNLQEQLQLLKSENITSVEPNTEKEPLPSHQIQSDVDMLDSIISNQKEKKKVLVKLMARMYSLESAVGYNHS